MTSAGCVRSPPALGSSMPRPSIWLVTSELPRGSSGRAVAEQIGRWRPRFVYSTSAGSWGFAGAEARIAHRAPGPQLVQYLWCLFANGHARVVDERRTGRPDAVVYRGINALDADAIGVSMVCARYWERVRALVVGGLGEHPASVRSRHRLLFVGLIRLIERHVHQGLALLWSISSEDARDLERRFERPPRTIPALPHGERCGGTTTPTEPPSL
jgi:hypothetical protein